ncbi:unnamed protein product, partial [Acidithrix sp. C25]
VQVEHLRAQSIQLGIDFADLHSLDDKHSSDRCIYRFLD